MFQNQLSPPSNNPLIISLISHCNNSERVISINIHIILTAALVSNHFLYYNNDIPQAVQQQQYLLFFLICICISNSSPDNNNKIRMKPAKPPQRAEKLLRVGLYDLEKTLGKGNFAIVRLGVHRLTKTKVAVKIVDKNDLDQDNLAKISREIEIMRQLSHPHIIQLYQVMQTDSMIYIVTEYASNGEIFDYLVQNTKYKEDEACHKFAQILSALKYCHKHQVVHRDLKAENLLLDSDMNIKLADFGFSNYYTADKLLTTWCGSPPYAAPELFEGKEYVGPKADIWSLGVVLYVLVSGSLPFEGATLQELRARIVGCQYRIPFFLSTECEQLLKGLLVLDPEKRLSLEQIARHPWTVRGRSNAKTAQLLDMIEHCSHDPEIHLNEAVIDRIVRMIGVSHETVIESVHQNKCDDVSAMYHLLNFSWKEAEKERERNCSSLTVSSPGPPLSPTSLSPFFPNASAETSSGDVTEIFTEDQLLAASREAINDTEKHLAARRHTLGPGQTPTTGIFGSVEPYPFPNYACGGPRILPQTNLTNLNMPLLSNQPLENFTIKDPHLLKPQLGLSMPHGRRASDGGSYFGQFQIADLMGSAAGNVMGESVQQSSSQLALEVPATSLQQQQQQSQPHHSIVSSKNSLESNSATENSLGVVVGCESGAAPTNISVGPCPQASVINHRAESPNPLLVDRYMNNRGQTKRHTIANPSMPESPRRRERRTGIKDTRPPEISPEVVRDYDNRSQSSSSSGHCGSQRALSPHQLSPFIPGSSVCTGAALDHQQYPFSSGPPSLSPMPSPSKPAPGGGAQRLRRTGNPHIPGHLSTVKENEKLSSGVVRDTSHHLNLPYSPIRRQSDGSPIFFRNSHCHTLTTQNSLPNSTDTSPSDLRLNVQEVQEEYQKLRSETNCTGSTDSNSSGYLSPKSFLTVRPPSPLSLTGGTEQLHRRSSDCGVFIPSEESSPVHKMKPSASNASSASDRSEPLKQLYDDMYGDPASTGQNSSRRFSYPNSPVHNTSGTNRATVEKQQSLTQNFQLLSLQKSIFGGGSSGGSSGGGVGGGTELLSTSVGSGASVGSTGFGSITQGVPRGKSATPTKEHRLLKTPNMAHSFSFDEASFHKPNMQQFSPLPWGKQYSLAGDELMSLQLPLAHGGIIATTLSEVESATQGLIDQFQVQNNPTIIVSNEMGHSEPMDESS